MRPYGFFGKPLFAVSVTSVHDRPPSAERNSPLPDRRIAAVAARAERPALAAEIPQRGEHHVGVLADRALIDEQPVERFSPLQHQRPGLAAVGRLVEAAIGRIAPQLAGHARVDGVAVACGSTRIRDDALGIRQAHVASRSRRRRSTCRCRRRSRPSCASTLRRCRPRSCSGSIGSIAIAPIDCTGCLSNTGLNVVPPSVDFHTPPDAAPTKSVVLPSLSGRAATAAMRPLIAAEPMLRAPRPEITPRVDDAALGPAAAAATRRRGSSVGAGRRRHRPPRSAVLRPGTRTRVVDGDVGFGVLDRDLRVARRALAPGRDREREAHAGDLLVIAEVGLVTLSRAAHAALRVMRISRK